MVPTFKLEIVQFASIVALARQVYVNNAHGVDDFFLHIELWAENKKRNFIKSDSSWPTNNLSKPEIVHKAQNTLKGPVLLVTFGLFRQEF